MAVGEQHRELELGDVRLHWTETGTGRPLVLLHGLNDSHRTWRDVWPRLPGRRILMLDLPGHGLSGRPDAPYTLEWNATRVARWMDRLGLRGADVVGHSYGGGVAQWLLLNARDRIRRLGLLAAGGLGREVYPWLRLASVPFVIESFGQPWMATVARFAIARATTARAPAEIERISSYLSEPGSARAFSRTVRDVIRLGGQRRHILDRIAEVADLPPMRLFWGDRDAVLPVSQGTATAALLEHCALVRFPRCGHFVQWEDPEGFARALAEFLDDPAARPARLAAEHRAAA